MEDSIMAADAHGDDRAPPPLMARPLPISWRCAHEYLAGNMSPARQLTNLAVADLMPSLTGKIIELGATSSGNHKRFAQTGTDYVLSNISNEPGCLYLDAMNMTLEDQSVDNFVSVASLEHMPDPCRALREVYRTLKPGGKLLLVVPFMYPFHAAPSDFFRFTDRGIAVMLKNFRILHAEAMGNRFSTCALFLQKPYEWAGIKNKFFTVVFRLMGLGFYLLSRAIRHPDNCPFNYCFVVQKP